MGYLYYGADPLPTRIPDRELAHLRTVATTKLRRNESFTVSWRHGSDEVPGRTSIWLQPSIPLRFVFDTADPAALDPDYLNAMARAAVASGGMTIDLDDAPAERALTPVPRAAPAAA